MKKTRKKEKSKSGTKSLKKSLTLFHRKSFFAYNFDFSSVDKLIQEYKSKK